MGDEAKPTKRRGRAVIGALPSNAATIKVPGTYNDGGGLRLRVSKTLARTWEHRYTIGGKTRDDFLGNARDISLSQAREMAAERRKQIRAGIDPIAARHAAQETAKAARRKKIGGAKFQAKANEFIALRDGRWGTGTMSEWRATIRDYCQSINNTPCEQIDADDIHALFDPLWRTKRKIAVRLRHRVASVLSFARAEDAKNEFFPKDWSNPAAWEDRLKTRYGADKRPEIVGYSYIEPAKVPEFIGELRQQDTTVALLLEFLVLTASRSGEARLATWDEFDLTNNMWLIPAKRMKGRRPHAVPLTLRAVEIIDTMRLRFGNNGLVFKGRTGGATGNTSMRKLMKIMGHEATPHGFRKSFKTWATEAGIRDDVSEMCLAHVDTNAVRRAYQKSDLMAERRRALEAWAAYIDRQPQSNVLPLFA